MLHSYTRNKKPYGAAFILRVKAEPITLFLASVNFPTASPTLDVFNLFNLLNY